MSANGPDDAEDDASRTHTGSQTAELSLSEIFDVLQNSRRRHVLKHLEGTDAAEFDDVVDHVAARDAGVEPGAADASIRKAAYTSLYQSHLPKLADLDVVEYDHGNRRVARGRNFHDVLSCLTTIERVRADDGEDRSARESKKGRLDSLRSVLGL